MTVQFRADALARVTLARELWAPLRTLVDGRIAGHIRLWSVFSVSRVIVLILWSDVAMKEEGELPDAGDEVTAESPKTSAPASPRATPVSPRATPVSPGLTDASPTELATSPAHSRHAQNAPPQLSTPERLAKGQTVHV